MTKKLLKKFAGIVDYPLFGCILILCMLGLPFAIPYVLKERRIWQKTSKRNEKVIFIQGFTIEKADKRGYEYLLPFRNPTLKWVGFLDPANSLDSDIEICSDLYILLRKTPQIVRVIDKIGFEATSVIFREIFAVILVVQYCNQNQIGVLRAYKHDYAALRAYIVSCILTIPYIVDISGNAELIRRLTGKPYYFKKLNRTPILKVFVPRLTNWLLGLPLRHAFHVFSRGVRSCEHAFIIGAPLERLSMLRISNFDATFNNYKDDKLPIRPLRNPFFLCVGRLAAIKFPIDVIEAFELAAEHLPDHHLVFIGDGTIRPVIEQKIRRSKFKNRIKLLGACSSKKVFQWTVHASAAICPLSGSTLVEAMLCRIPIIAYDVAWHAEVVIDDYTGYLVPFRDTKALAKKMVHVASNNEEARLVGKQGYNFARVVFDKEKILAKESIYYRKALSL